MLDRMAQSRKRRSRDRGAATRRRRTVQRYDQQGFTFVPGDRRNPTWCTFYTKLNVDSRTAAVAAAHQQGLIRRSRPRPRGVRSTGTIRGAQPEGVVVGADVSPHSWMKRAPWALKSARGEEPERPGSAVAKRRNQTRRLATPRYPCTLGGVRPRRRPIPKPPSRPTDRVEPQHRGRCCSSPHPGSRSGRSLATTALRPGYRRGVAGKDLTTCRSRTWSKDSTIVDDPLSAAGKRCAVT